MSHWHTVSRKARMSRCSGNVWRSSTSIKIRCTKQDVSLYLTNICSMIVARIPIDTTQVPDEVRRSARRLRYRVVEPTLAGEGGSEKGRGLEF